MVSKSKILGKPLVIFVTVGTISLPFYRLLDSVLRVIDKITYKKLEVVIQSGTTKLASIDKIPRVKTFPFINPSKMMAYIKNADKIISQTGIATPYQLVRHAEITPLLIPRLKKYGEHVDNHQLEFTQFLKDSVPSEYKKYFVVEEELDEIIYKYITEKRKENSLNLFLFKKENRRLVGLKIEEFIDRI